MLSPVWRSGGLRLSLFWQKLTVSCYLGLELDSGGKSCYSGAYVSTGKPYSGYRTTCPCSKKGGGLVMIT